MSVDNARYLGLQAHVPDDPVSIVIRSHNVFVRRLTGRTHHPGPWYCCVCGPAKFHFSLTRNDPFRSSEHKPLNAQFYVRKKRFLVFVAV